MNVYIYMYIYICIYIYMYIYIRQVCGVVSAHWGITLGEHCVLALVEGEAFVWPPQGFYPDGKCLWRLRKAMCGLRQAPKLGNDLQAWSSSMQA